MLLHHFICFYFRDGRGRSAGCGSWWLTRCRSGVDFEAPRKVFKQCDNVCCDSVRIARALSAEALGLRGLERFVCRV
jgi:hypothetical protein